MRRIIDFMLSGALGALIVLGADYQDHIETQEELAEAKVLAEQGEQAWLHALHDLSLCEMSLDYADTNLSEARHQLFIQAHTSSQE